MKLGKRTERSTQNKIRSRNPMEGTSLVVQWLRFYTSNERGTSSIPGWGLRPQVPLGTAKRKKKKKKAGREWA